MTHRPLTTVRLCVSEEEEQGEVEGEGEVQGRGGAKRSGRGRGVGHGGVFPLKTSLEEVTEAATAFKER